MLVTFESEVGRVTLFGSVAVELIRMMGRSGSIPGALLATEVEDALANLRQALAAEEQAAMAEQKSAGISGEDHEEDDRARPVSMRQRAFPLITLLEDARREGSDVMWEAQGSGPLHF